MYDILIIGAGAAGMTAALYALRNGKTVLLVEGNAVGGQIANSPRVENFPSIKSVSGAELADNMFEQVTALGAEAEIDNVLSLEKRADGSFKATAEYGEYEARSVIIATGVKHKKLNVPGEEELVGKGVSYCAVCDGPFYAGEEVALVGDANTAVQYGLLLSASCKKVYVCTWSDRFFGDSAPVERLLEKDNVVWKKNLVTVALEGEGELSACVFEPTGGGERVRLPVKACFVAIGQVPDNERFASLVDLTADGYFDSDERCLTRTAGLFVAGDCRKKGVRQLTTAVADGATAALAALAYLG